MSRSTVTAILSGIAIIGAGVAYLTLAVDLPPRTDGGIPREIGRTVAAEAHKLASGPGDYIVIARDTSTFKQPAADLVLASVLEEIRKSGGKISGVRAVELDPLRPVLVPASDFMDLIHSAPVGSVVISLMGPPLLTDEQRAQLGQINPKIVAFCSGNITGSGELQRLFDQGLLHTAIVARYLLEPVGSVEKSSPHLFGSQYTVVTKPPAGGSKPGPGGQP